MKSLKKYLLAFLAGALMLVALAACRSDPTPEAAAPTLTVSQTSISGKVRDKVTLPDATAIDYLEQDISEEIRIKIYFKEDEEYVLPQKNASLGVPLSKNKTFTPKKCGEYVITYFVTDEYDGEAESEVALTVGENPNGGLSQNLASVNNTENWLFGENSQNSALNEFGEITIAGKDASTAYGGASYCGQKLQNGDTVTVDFVGKETTNVWFYDFAYFLTPSAGLDAPTADEATWPTYFHIRIQKSSVQCFLFTFSNNDNYALFDQMSVSLLDGTQHSLSFSVEAFEDRVEASCWIDKAITTTPSAMNTIYKEEIEAKFPNDEQAIAPFNPQMTGWLSFGANITGQNISNDELVIKGVTINGDADLKTPSLKIGKIAKMTIDEEITLPKVTARDENDYSNLTSAVKLSLITPSGEAEEYTESTFTPNTAGEYIFRYTVMDGRGNLGYQDVVVLCSKGDSEEKPVIEFESELEETLTVKLNEEVTIIKPTAVTDSFGDNIMSRLKIELTGREKANLKDADSFIFRAAGENVLRYSVTDYNGNETVKEIKIIVTDGATGNILENSDDWHLIKATNDKSADTMRIDSAGASVVYGGQKIYDEKVNVLWNYDMAAPANGESGTNILIINLRGGKTSETVKTVNNPAGSTRWGWPEGLSVCVTRLYGILVKFGGWDGATVGTSEKEPDELYEMFHGKDTVLSMKATDIVGENGEVESVRVEVWVDGVKIKFAGSYIDSATGDVLLNKRYLRANAGVLEAGWLEFYFNEVDSVDNEKTVIKSITIDGTQPVQTVVTIDKEDDQEFVMNEPYTLPVVTVMVGEENKSSEVKAYIAAAGTEPDFTADPYTETTITPDMDYIRGFVIYYVYGGKVVKTVDVSNSSTVEVTLGTEEVTGAKVGTTFDIPTVTEAMLGSLDVTSDITAKIKVGLYEYEAGATYKPTSDEPVKISYYFYGKVVKTVTVTVAPDVARTTDFAQWVAVTGGSAVTWKSQKIYNNKIYIRFSLQKEFEATDLYDFTLRGGETDTGAWMNHHAGLNLSLYKDTNGVKFRVHANPNGHWPQTIFGESANSYHTLDWTARHSLVYSVYDKYDESGKFLGVTVEVWLDGEKVEFVKGADGAVIDGNVLISAQTVLADPVDHNGRKIYTDSFFAVFGMKNGATITKTMNIHHAYIMRPTDELPDMPEDPAVFAIDKEENQEFTIGQEYTLPVLTVTVGTENRSDRVKVYITAKNAELDLENATAHTGVTYTPAQDDYKGITVYYVYEGEVVKTINVANSASVEVELSTETISGAKAGAELTVPMVTSATLSGNDVKNEITVKIVFGEAETDATAGGSYTPLLAGTYTIVYSFNGKAVKTLEFEVAEGDKLEIILSAETVNAKVGTAFTIPTVVSAMLGDVDHKSEITQKMLIGTKVITGETTYTPWYDETIYIVYSFGETEVKRLEVTVAPADEAGIDLASEFEETPVHAMKYGKQFLYNNKAVLNFSVENDLVDGDIYEFGLRGGEQTSVGWCNYTQGLRIRLMKNVFGVYFQIIWGDNGAVTLAESVDKYTTLDWTAAHTMVYGAYDDYDEAGNFRGILVELSLDGSLVAFRLSESGADNGASIESGKVLISAEKVNDDPKDSSNVSVFEKSLYYIWFLNGTKKITVHHAYIIKADGELPQIPEATAENL